MIPTPCNLCGRPSTGYHCAACHEDFLDNPNRHVHGLGMHKRPKAKQRASGDIGPLAFSNRIGAGQVEQVFLHSRLEMGFKLLDETGDR